MADQLIDPVALLMTRPPGSAVWMLTPDGAAIAGREDRAGIKTYPMPCPVAHRLHAWQIDGVLVVAWLARLADRDSATWETWINAADQPHGRRALETLGRQANLDVHLYVRDPDRPARSVRSPNYLRGAAAQMLGRAQTLPPWTMAQFEAARETVQAKYWSVALLWAAGQDDGGGL